MKKLHSYVFYALVTPAITLGASSVMAEQSTSPKKSQYEQNTQQAAKQSDLQKKTDRHNSRSEPRSQNRGHIDVAPHNGSHASNLIGTDVRTNDNEDIGSVDDLIIDDDGLVVAIVVSVGGFLGIGQKDVAIGWDNITKSGTGDNQELRVDMTRADLEAAPKFEKRDQYGTQSATDRNNQRSQTAQQRAQQGQAKSEQAHAKQGANQSGLNQATDRRNSRDQSSMHNRGHIDSVPYNGMHASNLIGTDVRTNDNENIGSVDDLILDGSGQIVAIVVSVGGFLGMGQKDVAIGWDNITSSGTSDKQELRVDVTRADLNSAPKFAKRD
ncbi:MAG: PRC-barrel domain-containing protein [Alkalimonas sp.]|nr:PRC-barrel domain-containing protein [Alkalimonas sp.]